MKRKKITNITLMLAALAATSAMGVMALSNDVTASAAEATPYSLPLDSVFSATDKENLTAESITVGEETKKVSAIKFGDGEKAWLKRNLAYAWYEGKDNAKHFNMTFAFKDLSFKSVTIKMDSSSAWATEEEKTTNKIVITPTETGIDVKVNEETAVSVAYTAGNKLTLELVENGNHGELLAKLGGTTVGTFTNVGAKYASYSLNETHPLEFEADFGETKDLTGNEATTILLYNINGQDFYLNADSKIEDTAAPALVVNEDIEAFLLGSAFSLDYKVVDVLQESGLPTVDIKYYQYNPTDVVPEGKEEFEGLSKSSTASLFTSHNFFHTVYKLASGETTSVYDTFGEEYVAIRFLVGDTTHSGKDGAKAKKEYDLAWYVDEAKTIDTSNTKFDVGETKLRESALTYIAIDKNNAGPTYKILKLNDTDKKNDLLYNPDVKDETNPVYAYNKSLEEEAKGVYAGSNSYINLPSLNWLFEDNNSYNGLKFTISYKTETSSSASTTSVTPTTAKIPVSKEGIYEFKILATDSAGNPMKYYLDGELVDVTSSNVWDIEEIPYFTFTIENLGLKISSTYTSSSSRKDTKIKDSSYTFSDLKIVGATNLKESYALYKVGSFSAYNDTVEEKYQIKKSDLASVTYENIADKLDFTKVSNGDYFKLYVETYATLLAEEKGHTPTAEQLSLLVGAFERIGEAGDKVNGDEKYDVYEWSSSSQSFKTVEEGEYVIFADYWEGLAPSYNHATGYKVILVESEVATIEGESDWFKNNKTSVVLFSIAGVLLIFIIILMMVKPSDESLEDVEAKAAAKKERVLAKKDNKKNSK